MPVPTRTTRRTTTRSAPSAEGTVSRVQRTRDRLTKRVISFLETKNEAAALTKRTADLRDLLIEQVAAQGEKDEKGNSFLKLPEQITFKDFNGKVFKYKFLKRERHLSPANPLPIPERAEELLKAKKLWIKPAHQKAFH